DAGGPRHTASSANLTRGDSRSASEWTATVLIPISRAVRMILRAMSPRLATKSFFIFGIVLLSFVLFSWAQRDTEITPGFCSDALIKTDFCFHGIIVLFLADFTEKSTIRLNTKFKLLWIYLQN